MKALLVAVLLAIASCAPSHPPENHFHVFFFNQIPFTQDVRVRVAETNVFYLTETQSVPAGGIGDFELGTEPPEVVEMKCGWGVVNWTFPSGPCGFWVMNVTFPHAVTWYAYPTR